MKRQIERKTAKLSQLDHSSAVPLYYQIRQQLLSQIQSGVLKPGEPLPSMQEIAASLGVSPMTVRQAVKSLCELGVVYSRQGKGTFLSGIKLEKDFRQVLSFTEEMKARGSSPQSKILSFKIQRADAQVSDALRLKPDEEIIQLHRVRYSDNAAMGIECSSLPRRLCPDLLDIFDPKTSLYQTLLEHYGIRMTVADEIVEAGLANADEAALLKIKNGSPVFFFTRISCIPSGEPIEHVRSTYRGDRYKIVNRLTRLNVS